MNSQEYRGIKTEIIEISKLRLQLVALYVTIVATMTGYVYGSSTPPGYDKCEILVLGASILFLFFAFFIERLRCHLRRLTTYLYVIFEQKGRSSEYKWECYWKTFRMNEKPWSYTAPISALMCLALILCMIALWFQKDSYFVLNQHKAFSIIFLIVGMYTLWFSVIEKDFEKEKEEKLINTWENIKSEY